MSDQEMQFADPDWKPSQKLDAKTGAQEPETFIPEPINANSRERWNTAPPPPQQQMYTGLPPYAGTTPRQPVGGQYGPRQYRRGGRSIWFWVILAFIIISLMGGGFGSAFNRSFGPDYRQSQPQSAPVVDPAQNFTISGTPTVVINGDGGTIQVQTSADAKTVTVQDTKNASPFGDPNNLQVNYNQQGNTINASVPDGGQGSVDFTVTVPQGADLQFTTSSGNISFDGTIGTSGTDQFTTSSGTIDLTVSPDSAFHLNASTNSGSINTPDFPNVKVNKGGTQATGNVGIASHGQGATVTLKTDSGDIDVHQ